MQNQEWWKNAVVYQVYPRSFMDSNGDGIGDLPGVISKLDYIKKLGADVIWLNPIYASPNDDNGYDISDYRAIMPEFGTMADFDKLLAEAHKRGIRILMDLVVNHSSDEHYWFQKSRKSKDNPYRDYYIWREGKDGKEPNNWGASFGGSAWEKTEETGEYYLHLFSKKQPDLNWENPKLRQEVYDIMRFWLDKGVDGFRMDVINYISKTPDMPDGEVKGIYGEFAPFCVNGPRIHEFLHEMNREVLCHYPAMTVGEMPCVPADMACMYTAPEREEVSMLFQFEHMGLDRAFGGHLGKFEPKPLQLSELKKVLSRWQTELHGRGWNSLYWDNHDQPRIVSRFGDVSTEENRVLSAKMLGTLLHMMEGTPYVYEGEELGMTNNDFPTISDYRDIDTLDYYKEIKAQGTATEEEIMGAIAKYSRDNARTPMQWTDGEQAGFTTGTPWLMVNPNHVMLNAAAQVDDPDSVFSYYQKLITMRHEMPVIVSGEYRLVLEDHPQIYAYQRVLDGQTLNVICNFSAEPVTEEALLPYTEGHLLLNNYADADNRTGLRPWEARVYLSE